MIPHSVVEEDLSTALKISETQRKAGYDFVCIVAQDPNCVGKMGVDVTGPDYDWKKRRR